MLSSIFSGIGSFISGLFSSGKIKKKLNEIGNRLQKKLSEIEKSLSGYLADYNNLLFLIIIICFLLYLLIIRRR